MATSVRVGRRGEIVRLASLPHGKRFQASTALSTLIVVLILESLAQTGEPTADPNAATADHVIAQDANSRTVEWVEQITNAVSGYVSQRSHVYVEVGTGLNYQDESGRWRPSQDLIELTDDGGAVALHGSHKARFSPNLNTPGAITLTTSSNRLVRSHPLGLYYFAADTGQSTLIGLVKDSVAELHPPNQLVYRDCLEGEGVMADYRLTWTKAGMEADLILFRLPDPKALGISGSVRLEWFTEWLDMPGPRKRERVLKVEANAARRAVMVEPDLVDETLDLGDIWFPQGRAFAVDASGGQAADEPATIRVAGSGANVNELLVAKRLLEIDGRMVLVESADWRDVEPKVAALPGARADGGQVRNEAVRGRRLPAVRLAKAEVPVKSISRASASYAPRGFVLDYVVVSGSGNYTFANGVTYLISSSGYFSGTVTFGPNCVIKFANNACLLMYGSIVCKGSGSSYSILTSKDDDLYGEPIRGSTGTPTFAAHQAMWVYYVPFRTAIQGVKIRWAKKAVQYDSNSYLLSHAFRDSKLEQCDTGIYANNCAVSLINVTQCGVRTPTAPAAWPYFSGTMTEDCAGDTDSDGLPDSWEVSKFGNATSQNGTADPDGDGLTNLQEYQWGSNPISSDTDGDGLLDGWEVAIGLNPLMDQSEDPASRRNYNYDLLNRLTSVTGKGKVTITRDKEGNIQQVTP